MNLRLHPAGTPAPSADEIREALLAEGFIPSFWDAEPGASYPDYIHSKDEIVWAVSGRAMIKVGNETDELGPGDRVLIPAQTYHTVQVIGDEKLEFFAALKK